MLEISIVVFIALVLFVILSLSSKNQKQKGSYNYSKIPTLLSPAERSFFGVIGQVIEDAPVTVFVKVRVADVLRPQKGLDRSHWQRAFNRISSKHFDFVLCRQHDVSILCAIELNDVSHSTQKRKKRDDFLRKACESAHFPLLEVTAQRSYKLEELRAELAPYLQGAKLNSQE